MQKKAGIILFVNNFLGSGSPELYKVIDSISSINKYSKKEMLFFEGDRGKDFYFLVSGKVKLYKMSVSGKEVVVKIINPGEIFAEITIIENTYPVNAMALENSVVLKIDAEKFTSFLAGNENLNRRLMFLLLKRIKTLLSRLELVGTENVEERLIHYLYQLSLKKGKEFELPISKGELASLLFTSPETISRTFTRLRERGMIDMEGKKITVKKLT